MKTTKKERRKGGGIELKTEEIKEKEFHTGKRTPKWGSCPAKQESQ